MKRQGSGHRPRRVAERVRQVAAAFLAEEARDPRIGLVTITGCSVTGDLQRAVLQYVVHGDDAARAATAEGLAAAASAIRRRLAGQLDLRVVPEVVFEHDRGVDHAQRIEQLLASLERPPEPDD